MAMFNLTITAQRCYNGIVLCNVSSAVGKHYSNKRHADSQWNKVSIESIEVHIFRVIYGSLWIISIRTWSTFFAHLCISFFAFFTSFCFTVLNFSLNTVLAPTDWACRMIHVIEGPQILVAKSREKFTFPPCKTFWLIVDNTAKVMEMIHAATGAHSNYHIE